VSRADAKGMTDAQLRQVFKADSTKLPSYTGIEAPGGGYTVFRVSKVIDPASVDRAQQKSLGEGLAQMLGEEQFAAYLSSLKQKTKVRINKEQLERKQ
jgi:peptidyl-prolyl cis-trans isomerase D